MLQQNKSFLLLFVEIKSIKDILNFDKIFFLHITLALFTIEGQLIKTVKFEISNNSKSGQVGSKQYQVICFKRFYDLNK
ncbi:hypothetical protein BpHYR1_036756 [Brachionus plicatilis]|uniref:Uncharacterized protein n=1 Tax=Brachionus plicatilis TaxID=10195 RepID=A0A3M7QJT2_BRAPC|nr:hypothetical protein BpHYR1_036756 [Brachionus plicatilis]